MPLLCVPAVLAGSQSCRDVLPNCPQLADPGPDQCFLNTSAMIGNFWGEDGLCRRSCYACRDPEPYYSNITGPTPNNPQPELGLIVPVPELDALRSGSWILPLDPIAQALQQFGSFVAGVWQTWIGRPVFGRR